MTDKLHKSKKMRFNVFTLQKCFQQEISNAIDEANSFQKSFQYVLHPNTIEIDENHYKLPNGALNLKKTIKDIIKNDSTVNKFLSKNIVLISSLPFSDWDLVNEFSGKSLIKELNQCFFFDSFVSKAGWLALISTFIWEHLPEKKELKLPMSPSGRRALQPYLLLMFATLTLDRLVYMPFHEETRGCPFDYCNRVYDIDKTFKNRRICSDHEEYLKRKSKERKITKDQIMSVMALFNRAFGRPAIFKYDVAISYAHEDSFIAKRLWKAARSAGFKVFLDMYIDTWGKSLIEYLINVFERDSRYCLMLISEAYAESMWTEHERKAALRRALKDRGREYILPIQLDDTELDDFPFDLRWLDLRKPNEKKIKEIEKALIKKLDP